MNPQRMTRLIAGALLAGSLAACGNGDSNSLMKEGFAAGKSYLQSFRQDKAAAALSPAQVATVALSLKVPGTLVLATTQSSGQSTALAQNGTNGAYLTFTTPTRQNVTFKRGIISGTRGLGYDLMSAQMDGVIALVSGRREGTAQRVHQYITVESVERVMTLSCTVSRAGAETLPKATGGSVATTKMIERCTGDGQAHANQYWVLGDGYIWQSVQWISPEYGALVLQTLRR